MQNTYQLDNLKFCDCFNLNTNFQISQNKQVTRSRQKYMSCCVATMATNVKKDVEQPYMALFPVSTSPEP
jgi:hypothetical protein